MDVAIVRDGIIRCLHFKSNAEYIISVIKFSAHKNILTVGLKIYRIRVLRIIVRLVNHFLARCIEDIRHL